MSQNIKIKEGGTAMTFGGLERLIVPLSGSGESQWIPKSTVAAPDKSIDKNGTYRASSDGVYGWAQVSVSVQQSDHVTGKGPDGNSYTVSTDSGGNLTEKKVPDSIVITTLPTRLHYTNNDIIDFTGIVVTAYDGNGASMGVVPYDQLIFPTTIAYAENHGQEYADSHGGRWLYVVYSERHWTDAMGRARGAYISDPVGYRSNGVLVCVGCDSNSNSFCLTRYGDKYLYIRDSIVDSAFNGYEYDGSGYLMYAGRSVGTGTGDLVVLEDVDAYSEFVYVPISASEPGMYDLEPAYPEMTIPVQWRRPGDSKLLETSFVITVEPDTGGGGQAGDNGTGRND